MAKNIIMGQLNQPIVTVDLLVTISPETTAANAKSGDPVIATGNIPGVAENDYDSVTGFTPVNTHCIAELVVNGITAGGGNAAISAGDGLYMQTNGTIDKNSSGTGAVKFGTAFGNAISTSATGVDTRSGVLVASGSTTTTIRVWVGKIQF